MAVSLSGTVISSLFFEQGNSNSDQEGFLLGKVVSHVTDAISDSQLTTTKEETFTYVYSYLPCAGLFSWYDSSGRIIQDKLIQLLADNKHKEVVGWYKFRRCSSLKVSLRERAIHRHLKEAFPGIGLRHFLYCLCTVATSANNSTHSWDHVFLTFDGHSFRPSPVTVVNLGETAQSEYRLQSNTNNSPGGGTYSRTITRFLPTFIDSYGHMQSVTSTHNLNIHLHTELLDLSHSVAESERGVAELRAEVAALQKQIKPLPPPPLPPSPHRVFRDEGRKAKKTSQLRPPKKPLPRPDSDTSSNEDVDNSPSVLEPDLIVFDEHPDSDRLTDRKKASGADKKKPAVDLLTGIETPIDNPVAIVTSTLPDNGQAIEDKPQCYIPQDLDKSSDSDSASENKGFPSNKPRKTGDVFSFVEDILSKAKAPVVTRGQDQSADDSSDVSNHSHKVSNFSRSNSMPRHGSSAIRVHKKGGSDKGAKVKVKSKDAQEAMEIEESDSPTF